MKRLIDKLIVWLFWSKAFNDVRLAHMHIAYKQGKYDKEMEDKYEIEQFNHMEGTYEN
ncbi:hypothetical protein SAMN04487895_101504 [Paenibacillus sophorae]|uniref:Uncharacterized protein n=1 Tax=Paenibacillus sophorae TaxID=1333845 RepID=A0A1H8GG49_9BACL|nr:hypothetical protein [Paenibacillus sophorae]QWU14214.1 hypothetical protein KP014_20085 [Paenibacillus sophorae]SEN43016.1 hypothetical protein SAMN04487895_101504 [Paenibacillus sophorae]